MCGYWRDRRVAPAILENQTEWPTVDPAGGVEKMMLPHNRSFSQLAREEGMSEATRYNWRNEARTKGILLPEGDTGPEGWDCPGQICSCYGNSVPQRR